VKGDPKADETREKEAMDMSRKRVTYNERLGELLPGDKWV
jgi:hypothetical protein